MAVSLHDVRQALTELGRLRFGEMRVEDAMHEIVRTTHTIFDVDGAGLMIADAEHHLRNFAVSDERMGRLEELQIRHQEGPCVAAFDDKELVAAEDQGFVYGGDQAAQRQFRLVYKERHSWTNPATGAVLEFEVPREDIVLMPVAMQ